MLTLAEFGDADVPAALKEELTNMPPPIVKELSDYSLRPAIDIIRRSDQTWGSQWRTDRIVDGTLWRDSWLPFVTAIPKSLTDELLERASTEDLQRTGRGGGLALLAVKADAPLAKAVFMALRDHRRAMIADPQIKRNKR